MEQHTQIYFMEGLTKSKPLDCAMHNIYIALHNSDGMAMELTMATNQTPNYEIPAEMRDFAEKSVEQARKALDGYISAAQRAVDTFEGSADTVQASAKDMTRKTFSYAEQNISAAFDLAQRLVRAKDMQEAMQLQAEFVKQQFEAMQAQMKEFGAAAQTAMKKPTTKR